MNNNLHAATEDTIPESVRFYQGDRARCESVRHGQQCLRGPGHMGQHLAVAGAFMRWEAQATCEELAERASSALLWVEWAKALRLDPCAMQAELLLICQRTGCDPSDLLFNLFEGGK
ncbi:MAG: hypothetical protein PHX83_14635 [Acidobacteriia bacterium]|nr:hypothetical protein [Terriglobia bacterium]